MLAIAMSIDVPKPRHAVQLDPELQATDEVIDRWRRQTRDSNPMARSPLAVMVDQAEGAALPGGDEWLGDDVIAMDRVYAKSPPRVRAFVSTWYGPGTSEVKAARLGISRAAIYIEWKATLWFIRGMLLAFGVRV